MSAATITAAGLKMAARMRSRSGAAGAAVLSAGATYVVSLVGAGTGAGAAVWAAEPLVNAVPADGDTTAMSLTGVCALPAMSSEPAPVASP